MNDTGLEEAWRRFSENEVSIDAFFRSSGLLIGTEEKSFWEADLKKDAELKKFAALAQTSPSFHLSEQMAQLCDAYDRHAEALAIRIHALPMVPRWYPDAASRALGNMATNLCVLGRHEESVRLGERALAWDPTNPFVLYVLAHAYLHVGREGDAFAVVAYLDERGYPSSFARDDVLAEQKKLGVKKPPKFEPYRADLGRLLRLEEADAIRGIACNAHDFFHEIYVAVSPGFGAGLNASPLGDIIKVRNHALICRMAGRDSHARLAALGLAQIPRNKDNPRVDADVLWGRSLADLVLEAVPADDANPLVSPDEKRRLGAVTAAAKEGRRAVVQEALWDPNGKVVERAATILKREKSERSDLEDAFKEALRGVIDYIGWGDDDPRIPQPFPLQKGAGAVKGDAVAREVIGAITASKKPISALGRGVKPAPLPEKVIEALRFPNGKPLPPSLSAWLTFDAAWAELFEDPSKPAFSPMTLVDVLKLDYTEWLPDQFPEGFKTPAKLRGEFYPLPRSGDQGIYLYVGEADSRGEYPVLYIDPEDLVIRVRFAGFDMYLAYMFGVTVADVPTAEQARKNLGGDAIDLADCFGAGSTWDRGTKAAGAKKKTAAKAPAKPATAAKTKRVSKKK
ncbi:MAG: hypothetical protein HUU21_05545 [Polyangiaceae bacterium]|nr:hypothetical protein [Polyangiaceae bacterium]